MLTIAHCLACFIEVSSWKVPTKCWIQGAPHPKVDLTAPQIVHFNEPSRQFLERVLAIAGVSGSGAPVFAERLPVDEVELDEEAERESPPLEQAGVTGSGVK